MPSKKHISRENNLFDPASPMKKARYDVGHTLLSACRKRQSLFRQEGIAVRCAQGLCAFGTQTLHLRPEKYVLRRTWPRPPSLGLWPIHLAPPENILGFSLLPTGSKLCETFSTVSKQGMTLVIPCFVIRKTET